MRPALKHFRYNGDLRIAFTYQDGLTAELDFGSPHFSQGDTPLLQALRQESFFAQAYLDHGALTWPNGYDICPDILRHWCEHGLILAPEENDSFLFKLAADHADLALAG